MTRVHLVYPHGNAIATPDAIGRQLGLRLSERYPVIYHDLQEPGVIQPSSDDVLLGHAWPSQSIFEASCRQRGWKRVILMQPYCHGDNQDVFVERFIRHCDAFLAITGSYWFNDIANSKFKHWLPKMIHLDLAVDRHDYPILKTKFNAPGKRKFVYIGHNAPYKNTAYLAQIALQLPDIEFAWIGASHGLPGVKPLGRIDFATPEGKAQIAQYDFMLTVGKADGNPTTILEAMAWGLIPVCTPQSGYAGYPGIPNVPLGQLDQDATRLQELQWLPEADLRQMQQLNWEMLDHHFNWEYFTNQVIQAIESTDSPACLPIASRDRLVLLLGAYLDPRASFRQWLRQIGRQLRALISKSILTLLKHLLPTRLIVLGRRLLPIPTASDHYRITPPGEIKTETRLRDAWKDASIPAAQRAIVDVELQSMYQGEVVPIYRILAEAVRFTHCEDTPIIEVGCATGHYSEVLTHLLGHSIKYIGIDYSPAMLAVARRFYPHQNFALSDAVVLPFAEQSVELLISGCVLLHVPDYARVIIESARVARQWVIFHRTPVVAGPTIHYTKQAYGIPCLEIAFGERELFDLFEKNHLTVAHTFEIDAPSTPHAVYRGYGKTFVCRVTR